MANSIRGDGLFTAHRTLAALTNNSARLDSARRRFSESPPSYTSQQSNNSTLSRSPDPSNQEQRAVEKREFQIEQDHRASRPDYQFEAQLVEEYARVRNASAIPIILPSRDCAERVRERWIAQGIWRDEWSASEPGRFDAPGARWKHEDQYVSESETEDDTQDDDEPESKPFFFGIQTKMPRRRLKSKEERQLIADRRPARERAREASRPLPQFVYQVSLECDRILEEEEAALSAPPNRVAADIPNIPDINSRAYELVKHKWVDRGIWNVKWGLLPGLTWKHERPVEELLVDDAVLARAHLAADRRRAAEQALRERDGDVQIIQEPHGLFGNHIPEDLRVPPRPASVAPHPEPKPSSPSGLGVDQDSLIPDPSAHCAGMSPEPSDVPKLPRRRAGGQQRPAAVAGATLRAVQKQADRVRPVRPATLLVPDSPASLTLRRSSRLRSRNSDAISNLTDANYGNQRSPQQRTAQSRRNAVGPARSAAKPHGISKRLVRKQQ